jgi:starvation-inducible DNA-binding protein
MRTSPIHMPKIKKTSSHENKSENKPTTNPIKHPVYNTQIDIPTAQRETIVLSLNQLLIDGIELYHQIKLLHWNTIGPSYLFLHPYYDQVASKISIWTDDIAERIVQLGSPAMAYSKAIAVATLLKELPVGFIKDTQSVGYAVDALGLYANNLRTCIVSLSEAEDDVSADLVTTIAREADQLLGHLEASRRGET